jgi:hypothetical protein
MRSPKWLWIFIALVMVVSLIGCGGSGQSGEVPVTGETNTSGGGEAASPVDPATAATVSGQVNFSGTAPEPEPILMDAEPVCADKHANGAFSESVVVNPNGTLRNVFVYVKEDFPDLSFPTPTEPVLLDQNGCVYIPHVFGVQVGQDITIRNSDGILHNISPKPTVNRPFNIGQPVEMDTVRKFDQGEWYIPIECDVHDWMIGYVSVMNHPYFATTQEDGTFSLPNLPPGTYTIVAWHEQFGEQTQSVTVGESETSQIEFTFEGS